MSRDYARLACCCVLLLPFASCGSAWQDRQTYEWPVATGVAVRECASRRAGERVMPESWEVVFECGVGLPRVVSR